MIYTKIFQRCNDQSVESNSLKNKQLLSFGFLFKQDIVVLCAIQGVYRPWDLECLIACHTSL